MSRIIFVTGTDTGVGKTLMSGLLLVHLRESGVRALAMKPFCSGGRGDVNFLQPLQQHELPNESMNPFYFQEPAAPLVAARNRGRKIGLKETLEAIRGAGSRCECLIVEGAGGVLVPLGENFCVADLIARLKCDVVVVGRDKLGTINHTLLSVEALRARGVRRIKVVLMRERAPDLSVPHNAAIIAESLANIDVFSFPNLGAAARRSSGVKESAKKTKKTLARISDPDTFTPRCSERCETKTKRTD